ncbi:hypothetical protein CCP4SC76_5280014 [Gammaproteobacteria bacterium]
MIRLPDAPRELRKRFGIFATYTQCWLRVRHGYVPATKRSRVWHLTDDALGKLAASLSREHF